MTPTAPTSARDRSFVRKVIYLVAMAVLLMPLFWLSQPATRDTKDAKGQPGGKLAQLRDEHHLNQAELGQVDPSSETIRLATLGMRGIADDILWNKANNYQMKKDWTNLRATLEQISKLQPHSLAVWRYQAWNLSFNVSVAFDDYRDKYYWVIEGIKFLKEGVRNNERESRLYWDVGWFISHKIGRADEAKQYRRLFKQDDDFHGATPVALRDNWQVGKEWFKRAEDQIDARHPVRGMSEVIFYSDAPMCQYYYSEALEKEGRFEEVARRAWQKAADEWRDYGDREIPTGYDVSIRLNDEDKYEEAARRAAAAIDKLAPGLRDKIQKEKYARLTPDEKKAWDTPAEKRNNAQKTNAADCRARMEVTNDEVARRAPGDTRKEALKLAEEFNHQSDMATYVRRERTKVNFDYWKLRAEMEQTADALAARKTVTEADSAYAHGDFITARAGYERGLQGWRVLLDRFPAIEEDVSTGEDLVEIVRNYSKCLAQENKSLPKPFILQDIVDKYGNRR